MRLRPIAAALLVATLGSTALTGCDQEATPQELIERAKEFQAKGEINASVIELKNAIKQDPSNPEARWLLGEMYVKSGLGADAEKELVRARELGVDPDSIAVPLARSLLMQREYKRLLDEIVIAPGSTASHQAALLQLQGEARLGLGDADTGCALFDESARADPQYAAAYLGQAKCAYAEEDVEKARALVAQAKSLEPRGVQAYLLDAELASQLGDAKAAHSAYDEALTIEPDNMAALTGRAYASLQLKDFAAARKDIAQAKQQFPNSIPIKYLEALADFSEGKMEAARDKAQGILRAAPDNSSALLLLGLTSYNLGEYEAARTSLAKVLAQQPGNTEVRKMLAELMIKAGEGKQAAELMKPALEQAPDAETLAIAGSAAVLSGQLAEARTLFSEAAAKEPDQASLEMALAQTLLTSGKVDEGIEKLKLAAEHDTPDNQASKMLVTVLLQLKRYDEALANARALQAKLPGKALPYNLEGTVYVAQNDFASARKAFQQAKQVEPASDASALHLAQLELLEDKPEEARVALQTLSSAAAKSADALLLQAAIDRQDGNDAAYVESLKKALEASPASLEARLQLMDYYADKGQPKMVLEYTTDGDKYGERSPDYLGLKGMSQIKVGEAAAAVTTYQKLLQIAPKSPKAHIGMATAQAANGNLDGMRRALTTALTLDPDNPQALAEIALVEASAGEIDAALGHARTLQKRYPQSAVGFALEGDILLGQQKPAEAAKVYEKAFTLAPGEGVALSLFRAYYRAGDKSVAYARMNSWLEEHPDDLRGRAYLAAAYRDDGKLADAARELEYVLGKAPQNIAVVNDLALVYADLGDPRALQMAEKAYVMQPGSPAIADTYGWILLGDGQAEKALDILRKAADMAPKDPSIRYHLAQALAKTGSRAEAKRAAEDALQSGTAFKEAVEARQLLKELGP